MEIGGTVVARFELAECPDALDLALGLLDEADAKDLEVAFGAATGDLAEAADGTAVGAPLERAQLLVNRARGGELVLDARTREETREEFLFGRQVSAGPGAGRGITVDRDNPRRGESADAIAELGAPIFPPVGDAILDRIASELDQGKARTFVLRGPVGAGASELVAALAKRRGQRRVLRLGASPGGVVPLGSLRFALLRSFGDADGARAALEEWGTPSADAETIASVATGDFPSKDMLGAALAGALARQGDERAWVTLSPLSLVDRASLAALLTARESGADFAIMGRLPIETPLPSPLATLAETVSELEVPPLRTGDARIVAEAILGSETDAEVARQVAVLGGDTVIGVLEAARTLIATGTLVAEGARFDWRASPRDGAAAVSPAVLLGERVALLDPNARRVLEAACVIPDGATREFLEAVAARDGVGPGTFDLAVGRLEREAFASGGPRPRPTSSLLRWGMLALTPAARTMELHRLVGEALGAAPTETAPRRAELGFFLIAGGMVAEGRPWIARAVEALVGAGYRRAATQLSGWFAASTVEAASATKNRTPVPPPLESHDEPPPSSEIALDEILGIIPAPGAVESPGKPPPPPAPPPAAVRPKPPPPQPDPGDSLVLDLADLDDFGEPSPPRPPSEDLDPDTSDLPEPATLSSVEVELGELALDLDPDAGKSVEIDLEASGEFEFDDELSTEVTSVGPAPMPPFVREASRAIRAGDFATLEQVIERAVADGTNAAAVGRVRAVAQLARGDLSAARKCLDDVREESHEDPATEARFELTNALLRLRSGEAVAGVRAGLTALACSRELEDARGETAALRTLAACYRALGRDADAALVEAAR